MTKFSFLLGGALPLVTGCLAPPPESPSDAKATPAAPTAAASEKPAPDLSKPLVVWNGDEVSPASKGWAECDTKPCTATVAPTPKAGSNDSTGLAFTVDTSKGWAGCGWNFTSWYAAGASDLAGRKTLKLMLKIVAESPDAAPDLTSLQLGLRCAKAKECNAGVMGIAKYDPKAGDGQWHELSVPLADLKPDKGAIWDAGSVWELSISGWAPTPKKFAIHLDDIRFE